MFPKIVVPQNGWFIMEHLIKKGWFGGTPIFWKHPDEHAWLTIRECDHLIGFFILRGSVTWLELFRLSIKSKTRSAAMSKGRRAWSLLPCIEITRSWLTFIPVMFSWMFIPSWFFEYTMNFQYNIRQTGAHFEPAKNRHDKLLDKVVVNYI